MTVSELIEWLKTQDQDAIVQVVQHTTGKGYYDQGGNASVVDFTTEPCEPYCFLFDYTDFRDNQFVKSDAPHFNQRYLLLGEHNG